MPNLALGSDDDFSGKGRLIPTTAQDQLGATLASWLGVNDSEMSAIFPNLDNFTASPAAELSSAYLDLFA